MNRIHFLTALGLLLVLATEPYAVGPRGGGGRGGGGGGRGGGFSGGYRPSTPAISRPGPAPSRPNVPANRPAAKPGGIGPGNASRPNVPSPRPSPGGPARPNIPNTPNVSRPGNLPVAKPPIARPNPPTSGITRPDISKPSTGGIVPKPGDGNRPSTLPGIPLRPGTPGIADRPERTGPDRPDRPGIADRPSIPGAERPGTLPAVNRPPVSIGDRTIQANVNNVNVNRWSQYNQRIAVAHPVWNRPAYWNKPWYANRPAWYWGRPWYRHHWTWHHGYWNFWRTPPAVWFGVGAAIGWLSTPVDTVVYSNPYWVEPATVIVDYSQPIPPPEVDQAEAAYPPAPDDAALEAGDRLPTTLPPQQEEDASAKAANKLFGDARDLFRAVKYAEAQAKTEQAIQKLPSDATLHEFRSLTLFAQGKYKDAAAGLYAVLAAGPGWDWETVKFLYGNEKLYTEHLRALEEFVKENPKAGYAHFDLAYQYLVLGSKDSAVKEFEEVVRLHPDDKLATSLLKLLKE